MNEIMIHDNQPLSAAAIRANVNLIQEVMKSVMKKDVHYGTIPGTNKPTLYKAGSEKILSTFRIVVELEVEDLSFSDCFRFRVKARGVLPSGEVVGCGIGECSTDEEKYKWRGALTDKEFEATPEDRRRIKYSRPSNYNQEGETKQIRTNPSDLANTALKMAKKRAQIDLTLTATGASDVFDQDIEDLPEEYLSGVQKQPAGSRAAAAVEKINAAKEAQADGAKVNAAQIKLLHVKIASAGISEADFKAHYKLDHLADLPASSVNAALSALKNGEVKAKEPETATDEAVAKTPCEFCQRADGDHEAACPNNAA